MIPTREELEKLDVKAMDNAQCCISDVEEFAYCYRKSFATYIITWYEEQLRKQEPVAWYDPEHGLPYGWSEEPPTANAVYLYIHPQPAPEARDALLRRIEAFMSGQSCEATAIIKDCHAMLAAAPAYSPVVNDSEYKGE